MWTALPLYDRQCEWYPHLPRYEQPSAPIPPDRGSFLGRLDFIAVPRNGTSHAVRSIKPHTTQTRIAVQANDSTTPRMTTNSGHASAKRRHPEANCCDRCASAVPMITPQFLRSQGPITASIPLGRMCCTAQTMTTAPFVAPLQSCVDISRQRRRRLLTMTSPRRC